MWDVSVCVACLATDVRMYSMSASSLLQPYQLLAGVQFDEDNDYLPKKLCWECAALVNKFDLFRHKCERAYILLQDIYNRHDEIMDHHVKDKDREQHHLSSPLKITLIPSYTLKSRNVKIMKDTRREPVVTPPVKHEFEVQIMKEKDDLVKYEPELHLNEPSANSDNEEVESDWKNVQEPGVQEESSHGDLNVKKEVVKESSLQELGWTEVALTKERALEMYAQRKNSSKYKKAAYKCELCYRGFPDQAGCESHMSRHDPRHGNYECDFCKLRFNTIRNIRRHISLQHSKQYTCNMCRQSYFSKDSAQRHYRQHQKFGLVLNALRKSKRERKARLKKKKQKAKNTMRTNSFEFVERALTQEQMMEVVRERQFTDTYKKAPFKCSLCFKVFLEVKTYKNHMKQHDPVRGDFECDICKIRVRSRLKAYIHISTVHARSYTCKTCPVVSYSRTGAFDHQKYHKGIKYVCHVCGAQFSRAAGLANHVHRKHPALAAGHICGECGTSFPSAAGLRKHKSIMHQVATVPEENAPYCEECKVQFATTKAWTKHIINSDKHQEHIANGCRHCGETFASPAARRRHVSLEHPPRGKPATTDSKMFKNGPLPCALCGEMMESRMQYFWHFRRAHPGEPYPLRTVSSHACEECGRRFKCEALLRIHRRSHSGTRPYQCDVCAKAFASPQALRSHSATHSEERPHKCDLCGRGFHLKCNMTRHLRTHTGEKPYACTVCSQAFTTREWMLLHVRKVHNKEHIPTKPRVRKRKPTT